MGGHPAPGCDPRALTRRPTARSPLASGCSRPTRFGPLQATSAGRGLACGVAGRTREARRIAELLSPSRRVSGDLPSQQLPIVTRSAALPCHGGVGSRPDHDFRSSMRLGLLLRSSSAPQGVTQARLGALHTAKQLHRATPPRRAPLHYEQPSLTATAWTLARQAPSAISCSSPRTVHAPVRSPRLFMRSAR